MKIPFLFLLFLFMLNPSFGKDAINTELHAHAKNCPSKLKKDLSDLVSYLKKPTKNEAEAVEVFYYWITNNVKYNCSFGKIPM